MGDETNLNINADTEPVDLHKNLIVAQRFESINAHRLPGQHDEGYDRS
jgi:hypothetical protein